VHRSLPIVGSGQTRVPFCLDGRAAADADIARAATPAVPNWWRIPELADMAEMFDPGAPVYSRQRDIEPAIETVFVARYCNHQQSIGRFGHQGTRIGKRAGRPPVTGVGVGRRWRARTR
jgi:hypothetical protein